MSPSVLFRPVSSFSATVNNSCILIFQEINEHLKQLRIFLNIGCLFKKKIVLHNAISLSWHQSEHHHKRTKRPEVNCATKRKIRTQNTPQISPVFYTPDNVRKMIMRLGLIPRTIFVRQHHTK